MSRYSAMILSAGLGTRLRPFTYEYPKPLMPLCGRTLLEWNLQALQHVEIQQVGINTFHLAEQLPHALSHHSEHFHWSHEEVLQGTGGGVRDLHNVMQHQHYLIINGDAFFDFALADLLETHQKQQGVATLALRRVPANDPFARIGLDSLGRVVRIAEVLGPRADQEVAVGAFTGVQVIDASLCQSISEGFCDIFRSAYKSLMNQQADIFSYFVPDDSIWVDVGTPERYLAAHHAVYAKPSSRLWNDLPSYQRIGDGICFDRSQISTTISLSENTWIGAGAKVLGKSHLAHAIIWPDVSYQFDPNLNEFEKNMQKIIISAKGIHQM
jgi:NDP-sugar pyrophosphorylase family protein